MFQPKQPFEGQEAIEARLIETNDDGLTFISSQCISFAKERPDDFMNYLRYAWKQDGPTIREDKDLLNALQKVEVTRPRGETASLVSLYLPFPKLVYLQNRYLLPKESFRLLLSEYEITAGADLESWTAFADDIGLVHDDDGMFYTDLLAALKSRNENGDMEFPRRVLELYLRIQATYDMKGEEAMQKMTRSWEASSFELIALEKFYRDILQIDDGFLNVVLKELDKKPEFQHSKQLYEVSNKMWLGKLSGDDLDRLRAYFKSNQCIVLSADDTERYSLGDCIWAPKLNCTANLWDSFPELRSLFPGVLRVPSTDIGRVYDGLVNVKYSITVFGQTKEAQAVRLLVALSGDIDKYGHYLDKKKLLKNAIFPVTGNVWCPKLCSASAEFYIMDREDFYTNLRYKVPVLDIDYTTFWLLQPFFVWAGLEDRYLKNHVSIHNRYDPGSVTPPYIHSLRAKGLLRLAVHYRSPQTLMAFGRSSLARTLEKTRIHYLGDNSISTTLKIKSAEDAKVIAPYPDVVVLKNDDGLEIYLEKSSAEVARAVQLPARLAKILMTDPKDESKSIWPVDQTMVGLIRTILMTNNHNLPSIKMILDEEGIVDADKLQNSEYIPENDHGRLSRLLFDRKPDRPSGNDLSLPDQKPKSTEDKDQNNDLTQQLSSLSLQGAQDETDTSWGSDSTKETLV
ncbi:hypothetical protein FPRO06_07119 [Fusarium proliferatum]|nr:hypothetical protein FPRO06_07119 [Fusarium proliferatum]